MASHLCPSSSHSQGRPLRDILSPIDSLKECMCVCVCVCGHAKHERKGAALSLVCTSLAKEWGVPVKTRRLISGHAVRTTASMVDRCGGRQGTQKKAGSRRSGGLEACPPPNWCLQLPLPQGTFLLQNVLANGQGVDSLGKHKRSSEK